MASKNAPELQGFWSVAPVKPKATMQKQPEATTKGRIRLRRQFTLSPQAIERLKRMAGPAGNMSATIEKLILSK